MRRVIVQMGLIFLRVPNDGDAGAEKLIIAAEVSHSGRSLWDLLMFNQGDAIRHGSGCIRCMQFDHGIAIAEQRRPPIRDFCGSNWVMS